QTPWRVGLRTTPAPTGALALGADASLSFDADVALPDSATTLDATLRIGGLNLSYTQSSRSLILQLPCLPSLTLLPVPSAAALAAALNNLLPRVLFSSSAGALVGTLTGPNFRLGSLDCFLSETGAFLQRPSSLGNSSGSGLDTTKLTGLLQAINRL